MSDCTNCNKSQDSSGFNSGFFMGLIVGGAGGYLLSTDKGKELLGDLKDDAGDKLREIVDNPIIADKLLELEETMGQARATLNQAATSVARVTATADKTKKKSFFRRGNPLK